MVHGQAQILAIDPGLHHCGLAWFEARTEQLLKTEVVKGLGNLDIVVSAVSQSQRLNKVIVVVIEEPQIFASSTKGMAAHNSGAVNKLIALVFSLRQLCLDRGLKVVLAPVTKWKGNVPKEVMARRLSRYYDLTQRTSDEIDAVGIGRWYLRTILQAP